jgi:EPS-associated MarR family transcriptional regulator
LDDETRYRLLRALEANPELSQRELAAELGVSVGKANYCLRALFDKGLVKLGNARRNPDKRAYIYLLTPQGIKEKAAVAHRFLQRKQAEYEALGREIEDLRTEVAASGRLGGMEEEGS